MMSAILFVISFGIGPLLFWALARLRPGRGYVTGLAVVAILLGGGALVLSRGAADTRVAAYGIVGLAWLGWIMVMALCTLAVRSRMAQSIWPSLTFALCAMATTLPWFGLLTASTMGD